MKRRSEASGPKVGVSVTLSALTKDFVRGPERICALGGIELRIAAGETVAVMGPSGSGKSTLLHLIAAMDAPTTGEIAVGTDLVHRLRGAEAARYRRRVGFVFQTFNLVSSLTALDNVLAPVIPLGQARRREGYARSLLARVGLEARAEALPSELSGGERQRVAVARALIGEPVLLLADEPTGNLDSESGTAVVELLLEVAAERSATLLVATHNSDVGAAMGRVVRLHDGRLA